jgi:hypothetical protein
MNTMKLLLICCSILAIITLFGCASSEEGTQQTTAAQAPVEQPTKPEPKLPEKVDTVNIDVNTATKPDYESKVIPPPIILPKKQKIGRAHV